MGKRYAFLLMVFLIAVALACGGEDVEPTITLAPTLAVQEPEASAVAPTETVVTAAPTELPSPQPTDTAAATNTARPTATDKPTDTPEPPTNTPVPTIPLATNTLAPTIAPPTFTLVPTPPPATDIPQPTSPPLSTDTPVPPLPTDTPIPAPPTETPVPPPPPAPAGCDICSYDAYNCGNFNTHNEAQACHDHCMQIVGYDVHKLDGNDNDGLACESLP